MERLKQRQKSLRDFTYTDKEIADEIYAAMNSTQFLGISVSKLKRAWEVGLKKNKTVLLKGYTESCDST